MMENINRAGVEALAADRIGEAAELAALCMADNSYYADLYQGLTRRERLDQMRERIKNTLVYCAANDGLFGVTDGRGLAAYEYLVDYRKLKEETPALCRAIFSYGDAAGEAPHLREIERRLAELLAAGRRITYILGCGVAPWARNSLFALAAMAHFNKRLLLSEEVIAADFSNRALLSLCARHGSFEITALGRDYWFFLRK